MYFLMNKDKIVGYFDIDEEQHKISRQLQPASNLSFPIGFQNIKSWVENRKASKHNSHLREIMDDCGCSTMTGFIKVTHAASINDTFWIKNEKEDVSWAQVSFYCNPFDEVISKLAFEGLGLYGIKLSSTSPELCTDGSFRKCWIRDDVEDKIYLYKRGSNGARNAGMEPYCEVMASELAEKLLGKDAVKYKLVHLHGELASRCELFSNEEYGYTPISRFDNIMADDLQSLLHFYNELGSEDMFRRMLVLDSLTFNVDRHAGNHGVLVDNDTQKPVRMAPVFDMNLSMLPYIEDDDMLDIGTTLERYTPCIGNDFTRIGQIALTSAIRSDLIGLKGFKFSFHGDERFTPKRVEFIETLINRQIDAILSKEALCMKDVFIPAAKMESKQKNTASEYEVLADRLWKEYNFNAYFSAYDLTAKNGHPEMILYLKSVPNKTVCLDLETGKAAACIDDIEADPSELLRQKNLSEAWGVVSHAYSEEA